MTGETKDLVCCPDLNCGAEFSIDARQVGTAIVCPTCALPMTAKTKRVWSILAQRQANYDVGQARPVDVASRGKERRARELRELFWAHQPVERDPRFAHQRHRVHYEAGVDSPHALGRSIEGLVTVLDDLRSGWNVGSIFRTADCAGWGAVELCGITPLPTADIVGRVALDAESFVPWRYRCRVLESLSKLSTAGYRLAALEVTSDAVGLYDYPVPERLALVLGNEVGGVSREALAVCQDRVAIPLAGHKASLNVAVAFGVAAFELRRRWLERFGLVGRRLLRPDGIAR
jgi:tRNA G18 (ribose-2'-O)-methylase SpoU